MENLNLKIVVILTFGFGFATVLGYLSHRLKLSPILGYLIAGYLIGPFSPGYSADVEISEQLAEIGVILMMFGVGMHFKWQDLLSTSRISIPGAIIQTLITTLLVSCLIYFMGWPLESGIIFGLAIAVASTVVLVRVLSDNRLLNTREGHIAVGWLIIEDLITVAALLIITPLASSLQGEKVSILGVFISFSIVLAEFFVLAFVMLTVGRKVVTYALSKILATKSHELFTLSILAITFFLATGSALFLGTSIALGAFLAGIVLGQSSMSREVAHHSTPLQDTFVVIFFLSIGMLFDPKAIYEHFFLFSGVLFIILIIKPAIAFGLTILMKYPLNTALTISLALAQIGEFSFILAEEATRYKVMPDEGYDILVACAFVSIALNPLIFRQGRFFVFSETKDLSN